MIYKIKMLKSALKDYQKIKNSKLSKTVKDLFEIIEKDPYAYPPKFEHLKGDMEGSISMRINKQHRLIYKIEEKEIIIVAMWTHYETF